MDRDLREILRRLEALERGGRPDERSQAPRDHYDDAPRDRDHPSRYEHSRHEEFRRSDSNERRDGPDRPGGPPRPEHRPRWDDPEQRHRDAHSPPPPPPPPPHQESHEHHHAEEEPGGEELKFAQLVARIVSDRVREIVRAEIERRFGPTGDGPRSGESPTTDHAPSDRGDDHSGRH